MVTLQPMTPEEYGVYLEPAIAEYAQGHVEDGQWSADEALTRSRQEFQGLLPEGVNSPNNYLFTLVNAEHQKRRYALVRHARGPGHAYGLGL